MQNENASQALPRNPTRAVRIGSVTIGDHNPIVVQSMCATKTVDVEATVCQTEALAAAGAGVVRVAVDSRADAEALAAIREKTRANLSVDLQENYRLAVDVAPWVDKIRYNPGHLYHHERERPWPDKVRFLADTAQKYDCAVRVGVNCGSVDPSQREKFAPGDSVGPMLASALEHCELLDQLGFVRYCVSLKDSDPAKVVQVNRRFADQRPDVPLHLGVTEAGMPPEGLLKTRIAFEQLIARGIGDTIRVSLTLPNARKHEEVEAGRQMLADIAERYLAIDCACFTPNDERLDHIVEMARQLHADGVIHYALLFCTPYAMEAHRVGKRLRRENVPLLSLETDYSTEDVAQLETRVQAFLEMLGH